ncbi:MAG: hypothetical protein AAF539_06185 [Planctomycetota bacterium]
MPVRNSDGTQATASNVTASLSSHPLALPTINNTLGQIEIVYTDLNPALAEGDIPKLIINGEIDEEAFVSPWTIELFVMSRMQGTDNANTVAPDNAGILAAIAGIEPNSEVAAENFMTSLLARLSGEIPAITSGYQPQTQTLMLIEGADYAADSIPGPLEVPLPVNVQYEAGDPVWLNRKLGFSKVVQPQWTGEIAVVDGSAVARFVDVSPSAAGVGTWELWHKNNDGKRWMPTSGKLEVKDAIQTIPAG